MYRLDRSDLEWILDAPAPSASFPILKRNEIKQFGEYRTQRYVLQAFDQLQRGELPDLKASSSKSLRLGAGRLSLWCHSTSSPALLVRSSLPWISGSGRALASSALLGHRRQPTQELGQATRIG